MAHTKQKKTTITKVSAPKKKAGGNLKKHFGKLKLGIDGLSYQKKLRSEWD
ncbi:MAG: hypothetical protein HYR66_03000 [Sphingobacteriales bacterium]|nr:hypothetical protein [Sphingobacteriales bacterium]MBI3718319.1 hypothetical protein [Sphingobacteriales bacterium]